MRTTLTLADDVARAVENLRRERGIGVSEAVNELIRRGIMSKPQQQPFAARTRRMGIRIDVSNVADALDLLEGPDAR